MSAPVYSPGTIALAKAVIAQMSARDLSNDPILKGTLESAIRAFVEDETEKPCRRSNARTFEFHVDTVEVSDVYAEMTYCPRERGSRDSYGQQLEPDYDESIEIEKLYTRRHGDVTELDMATVSESELANIRDQALEEYCDRQDGMAEDAAEMAIESRRDREADEVARG